MKNIKFALAALALAVSAQAQTALTQTTLSAAMGATDTSMALTSGTGVVNRYFACIYDFGASNCELVRITNATNTTAPVVQRTKPVAHLSGAVVLIGPAGAFNTFNPSGGCTAANTSYTPWVNTQTGEQWICSTLTSNLQWVAGWGNYSADPSPTANVASAAGAIIPSGPLFHITGTAAITGFTLPVGFHGGSFAAIFDGAATWTTAGNISNASLEAMTAGCLVRFTYENAEGKFHPSTLTCNPTP